jgi:hypothetical protein
VDNPRIAYAPRPDATPEGELNALANVYRYVLNKNAAGMTSTNGGDAMKGSRNDRATQQYTR